MDDVCNHRTRCANLGRDDRGSKCREEAAPEAGLWSTLRFWVSVGQKAGSMVSWKSVGPGKAGEEMLPGGEAPSSCWKQSKSRTKRWGLGNMESSWHLHKLLQCNELTYLHELSFHWWLPVSYHWFWFLSRPAFIPFHDNYSWEATKYRRKSMVCGLR